MQLFLPTLNRYCFILLQVVSWGCNDHGQLGFSSISSSAVAIPTEIPELKKNIRRVACGRKHVIALCTDWSAQFWGDGEVFRPSSIYSSSPPAMLPIKLHRLRYENNFLLFLEI